MPIVEIQDIVFCDRKRDPQLGEQAGFPALAQKPSGVVGIGLPRRIGHGCVGVGDCIVCKLAGCPVVIAQAKRADDAIVFDFVLHKKASLCRPSQPEVAARPDARRGREGRIIHTNGGTHPRTAHVDPLVLLLLVFLAEREMVYTTFENFESWTVVTLNEGYGSRTVASPGIDSRGGITCRMDPSLPYPPPSVIFKKVSARCTAAA